MLGFFEFLFQNQGYLVAGLIVGVVMGLIYGSGEPMVDKLKNIGLAVAFYGLLAAPLLARMDYNDYKRHYITCAKYEAKQAGYMFHDNRCYKPVNGTQYIKVNDTLKTKKELQNG